VRFGGILKETVAASAAAAVVAIIAGAVLGHFSSGAGLAAGLLIGSLNGHALAALMARGAPFVASTIVRLAAFSAVAIAVAILLRSDAWAVLLGVAAAQLLMVATAVRRGLSTR
jgi:hypothetical protein